MRILLLNQIYFNIRYYQIQDFIRKSTLPTMSVGSMWSSSVHEVIFEYGMFSGSEFTELENSVLVF